MMFSENLLRRSGLANLLGGAFLALFFVLHPGGGDPPPSAQVVLASPYTLEHLLGLAALALLLLGLPALYAAASIRHGWLERIGFPLAFVGNYLLGGVLFFDAVITPAVAANAPAMLDPTGALNSPPPVIFFALSGILWGLGYLLVAIGALRSGVLSRSASLLVVAGSIVVNLPPQPLGFAPLQLIAAGAVIMGAGLCGWGYRLWSGAAARRSTGPQAHPAVV